MKKFEKGNKALELAKRTKHNPDPMVTEFRQAIEIVKRGISSSWVDLDEHDKCRLINDLISAEKAILI